MMKPYEIWLAILKRWWSLTVPARLVMNGVKIAPGAVFYGMPIISMAESSDITIGSRVVLTSCSEFTALGVSRPIILRTLRPNARISIDIDSGLSGVAICAAISVDIGSRCLIGADVQIFDNDFHKIEPENRRFDNMPGSIRCAPVVVGDNVFIGAGSKIMKGVRIGCNSIIGAGAIVTKDIPSYSVAVGNPAKVVRQLSL